MKYTNKLGLPIWDNPETDVFDIGEFNKGNQVVDDNITNLIDRITNLESSGGSGTGLFDNIMYNINQFPRLTNETNDYNRFLRALQSIKSGSTLLFDGTYDFGTQALPITKSVHLKGKNIETSIIKNGLINIKASNVTFSDFFIDAINYADGFKANDVAC